MSRSLLTGHLDALIGKLANMTVNQESVMIVLFVWCAVVVLEL